MAPPRDTAFISISTLNQFPQNLWFCSFKLMGWKCCYIHKYFCVLELQLARLPINPKVVQVCFFCESVSLTPESVNHFYIAHDRTLKKRERLSSNSCYEVENTQFCSMSLRSIVAHEQTELWSVTQASPITTDTHFNPSWFSWSIISSPGMAFLTDKST